MGTKFDMLLTERLGLLRQRPQLGGRRIGSFSIIRASELTILLRPNT